MGVVRTERQTLMPLWYIYYRVLRECRRSPLPGPEIRLSDVLDDLREKAIVECASSNSLAFHEFMERMAILNGVLDQEALQKIMSGASWFNPVKQG